MIVIVCGLGLVYTFPASNCLGFAALLILRKLKGGGCQKKSPKKVGFLTDSNAISDIFVGALFSRWAY